MCLEYSECIARECLKNGLDIHTICRIASYLGFEDKMSRIRLIDTLISQIASCLIVVGTKCVI